MTTFIKDEAGVTAVEYGILVAFGFTLITTVYGSAFYKIADALDLVTTTLSVAQYYGDVQDSTG